MSEDHQIDCVGRPRKKIAFLIIIALKSEKKFLIFSAGKRS